MRATESGPIWLVGASGVVGKWLGPLVARELGRPIRVVGRTEERAASVLAAIREAGGVASFLAWDVTRGAPPAEEVSAVVCLVHDPHDTVLDAVLAAGVPLVEISRGTARTAHAAARIALATPRAPVLLASGWMAGLSARVAAVLSAQLGGAEEVDISVRYAMNDAAGADSVDTMDRLWVPFEVMQDGARRMVMPLSDPRTVEVAGHQTWVYRLDTPEQWSLPLTLGLTSCSLRLGFESRAMSWSFAALRRLGLFWMLRGERFRGLRHALLRPAGAETRAGAETGVRVEARSHRAGVRAVSLLDPAGQAHLTAVGALLGLREVLRPDAPHGLRFPEQASTDHRLLEELPRLGVQVRREGSHDEPARSHDARSDLRREPASARHGGSARA